MFKNEIILIFVNYLNYVYKKMMDYLEVFRYVKGKKIFTSRMII